MSYHHLPLISEAGLASARRELGTALPRILGYFRQDGMSSISAIEAAMHGRNPTAMVIPAHTLKGESRQLGVGRLSDLAEHLEMTARRCIEDRSALPETLAEDVRGLRALFQQTIAQLEQLVNAEQPAAPVAPRARVIPGAPQRPVFGRRAP